MPSSAPITPAASLDAVMGSLESLISPYRAKAISKEIFSLTELQIYDFLNRLQQILLAIKSPALDHVFMLSIRRQLMFQRHLLLHDAERYTTLEPYISFYKDAVRFFNEKKNEFSAVAPRAAHVFADLPDLSAATLVSMSYDCP